MVVEIESDEERLAEIDRQLEALGQPETPVEVLLANVSALGLDEVDAILDELSEGRDLDIELAPLPALDELPRGTTSVSEPPIAEPAATEEFPALALDEDEFDLPPPSAPAAALEEDLLGSGLEDLARSDVPEPLSASMAAWIDPPDSEAPSEAPSSSVEMPPDPRIPDLGGFEEEEEERTGLFSQEDIDAIRASSPPPPRSAPPPASRSLVPSVPPPVPDKRPPPASGPPLPIPMSVAPVASDEDLEILDEDDFELMIEDDAFDLGEDSGPGDAGLDELIETGFEDSTAADEDEPVIREPEVETPAAAEGETRADEDEEEEGEKKGFFKKLFG